MTAVTDFTTVCTILKGLAPTNAQLMKVASLFSEYLNTDNPTTEQKAAAALLGMKTEIRKRLRAIAESSVYGDALKVAPYPADQPALLAAAKAAAEAAGDAAEGSL